MTTQQIAWMMRHTARSIYHAARTVPTQIAQWSRFWQSYSDYNRMAPADQRAAWQHLYPCLGDDTDQTYIEPTYFYQDCWAFERIVNQRPKLHVDVGSHHKFVALLSKVVPVTMVDIRPLSLPLDTLQFREGSILELPFKDGELESISSLCVVEHIGLGRYGDPLDPLGSEKAITELKRVTAPGGHLFISVPMDENNVVAFNAGRIFSREYLFHLFEPFDVVEERYIVGTSFQDQYVPQSKFGTTGLFELSRQP